MADSVPVIFRTEVLFAVHDDFKTPPLTDSQWCYALLQGNASPVQQSVPRPAKLKRTDDGKFYISGTPRFADTISIPPPPSAATTTTPQAESAKHEAIIAKVIRQLPDSTVYEVELKNVSSTLQGLSNTTIKDILLHEFRLAGNLQCATNGFADTIATFVVEDQDSKQFNMLVSKGFETLKQRGDSDGFDTLEAYVGRDFKPSVMYKNIVKAAIENILENYQLVCNGKPGGRCEEMVDVAIQGAGEIPPYKVYMANTGSFKEDLHASFVVGGLKEEEEGEKAAPSMAGEEESKGAVVIHVGEAPTMTVKESNDALVELTSFFMVDQASYETLQRKEQQLRTNMKTHKNQCVAKFLLMIHRNTFEAYLAELNDMWQQPNVSSTQVTAIMWLLYYTQLPIFVLKLLEMLSSELRSPDNVQDRIHSLLLVYHKALTKNLNSFLPQLSSSSSSTHQKDMDEVVQYVRKCLHNLRVPVGEHMNRIVSKNTPTCLRD